MPPGTPPNVPRLIPFTVGDWLVEPKACRVSRGDTVAKLRPQLADLLVCLARRAESARRPGVVWIGTVPSGGLC